MTLADDSEDALPEPARRAFESHDAFAPAPADGDPAAAVDGPTFAVASTGFEAVVTASEGEDHTDRYTVVVEVPSLDAATSDQVGAAVRSGWFETMERRLADAPKSTRASVDLEIYHLADADETGDTLRVTYAFAFDSAERAAAIAKTFVEYVEGTYVESAIPGYEYEGVVGDLLASATSTGGAGGDGPGGSGGPTPL